MPDIRRGCGIVAVLCAVLGTCSVARAQSAADGFDPGANDRVNAIAVQPDGKILIGGAFTLLGGGGFGTTTRNYIGRLNANGSLDTSFNPGANDAVWALAVQPDGKILVGGLFTALGGGTATTARQHIGRLNANGSVDTSFNPGANAGVLAVAVQADGKILVSGHFTTLGGGGAGTVTRNRIGRLNADGSVDSTFNPGANNAVWTVSEQRDGKILVGGFFTALGGGTGTTIRSRIGRLNANGSVDTSFNPGASFDVYAVVVQPDGKVLVGGAFMTLGGGGLGTTTRNHLGRLNADGSLDAAFDPGANGAVQAMAAQPDGTILVGGDFTTLGGGGAGTTTRNHLGRLNADGSLDTAFNPGANDVVRVMAVQPDRTILAGGVFTTLGGGGTGTTPRNYLGRLYIDGSLDATFDQGADFTVYALAVQMDGKILVGGDFSALGGVTRHSIARLNADGSLDASFNPGAGGVYAMAVQPDGKILVGGFFTTLGGGGVGTTTRNRIGRLNADGSLDAFNPGANDVVEVLALQADGRILVGGSFTTLGGTPRNYIGRLNADGSLDLDFNPAANGGGVFALAVQADGKILVGGGFTTLGGVARNHIGRLNADGSVDTSFNPGADNRVSAFAVQPDGKILVGGGFTTLGGVPRNFIGRLNANGSADISFDPGANDEVSTLAVQADGKILVGGAFIGLGGSTGTTKRDSIGRLNADGSIDFSFNPHADGRGILPPRTFALAVQADGKIVVGGYFGGLGGAPRDYIGRLTNTDAAIQRLRVMGGGRVVTWSRSGASPELGRVTFELATDGATYTWLGDGAYVAGGWQLTGQHLATSQALYIRARGYYATGESDGSGSIVESVQTVYIPTYLPFADDILTAGASLIRAAHVTELRTRIDALRGRFGLAPFSWVDPLLTVGTTVLAFHVTELRTALQEAFAAAGRAAPIFTDATIAAGGAAIRAVHIEDLRGAVIDLEGS